MDKIRIYRVNAFTCRGRGGNPAGVVLDAQELSSDRRQEIAGRLGYSETVFVESMGDRRFRCEFYTPGNQVDLCGHATIGCFSLLKKLGIIEAGEYEQVTAAGTLRVRVEESVLMEQKRAEFLGAVPEKTVAESLGIEAADLGETPVEIVSTGLRDIIIPVKDLETLRGIKPDFKRIEEISEEYGVVGYHLFTRESIEGNTAFTRNFAPLYDIEEESATGTSNGALGAYLRRYGKAGERMVFEQGDYMESPSRIEVAVEDGEVWAGGDGELIEEFILEI